MSITRQHNWLKDGDHPISRANYDVCYEIIKEHLPHHKGHTLFFDALLTLIISGNPSLLIKNATHIAVTDNVHDELYEKYAVMREIDGYTARCECCWEIYHKLWHIRGMENPFLYVDKLYHEVDTLCMRKMVIISDLCIATITLRDLQKELIKLLVIEQCLIRDVGYIMRKWYIRVFLLQ